MRAILAATLVLLGCGGPQPDPRLWSHAPRTIVSTPGVVIEAEDGSFRLVAGDPVPTPFVTYDCPALPVSANYELALRLGARPVRIHHPLVVEPLYGVLSLCPLHPAASSAVRRSYDIRIEDIRVEETRGGLTSVQYEPHGEAKRYAGVDVFVPAFALWMARDPLR